MGCGDACPAVPGKRHEDWRVPDPARKGIDGFRRADVEIHDLRTPLRGRLRRRTTPTRRLPMRYVFVIYEAPADVAGRGEPSIEPYIAAWRAYYKAMVA